MKQSEATSLAARKRGKWGYIWPMWTSLLLHLLAILLFTTGFLLTRTELPYHSHCSDVSHSPCFSSNNNGSCWTKPATNRLLIIVLDALRYTLLYTMHFHIWMMFTAITNSLFALCYLICVSGLILLLPVPSLQVITYLAYC